MMSALALVWVNGHYRWLWFVGLGLLTVYALRRINRPDAT
jgi:hypothetical protein